MSTTEGMSATATVFIGLRIGWETDVGNVAVLTGTIVGVEEGMPASSVAVASFSTRTVGTAMGMVFRRGASRTL